MGKRGVENPQGTAKQVLYDAAELFILTGLKEEVDGGFYGVAHAVGGNHEAVEGIIDGIVAKLIERGVVIKKLEDDFPEDLGQELLVEVRKVLGLDPIDSNSN